MALEAWAIYPSASEIAQGDVVFAQGDYESALVYYTSALQKYEQLGDEIQKEAVQAKLDVTMRKIEDKDKLASVILQVLHQAVSQVDGVIHGDIACRQFQFFFDIIQTGYLRQ